MAQEQKYPGDADAGAKPVKRLEFAYDAYGRRVSKTVLGNERAFNGSLVNGTWTFAKQTVFLWQDWTLLAEFVRTTSSGSLSLRRSYLWGLDIDGTLGGAGGVGGLLWVADYVPGIAGSNRQLAPCYDGNGNIMSWVENAGGQVLPLHRLEYGPYGRLLVEEEARVVRTKKQRDLGVTEEWLERPAFGFSTKYEDVETGLLYYGYRYYAPEMGRWISRDPIGEDGGINLYAMVGNDPVNKVDILRLIGGGRGNPSKPPSSHHPINPEVNEEFAWHHTKHQILLSGCCCTIKEMLDMARKHLRTFDLFNGANTGAWGKVSNNHAMFRPQSLSNYIAAVAGNVIGVATYIGPTGSPYDLQATKIKLASFNW